ncbi:PPE domain-containing protein [Nocardia sp. NPDC004168]|uniref:PPE domain-containing protein n=1 Tax=Nocardia sp. NPDC004168 TaxID=3154452 RepID=UPI0033B057A4
MSLAAKPSRDWPEVHAGRRRSIREHSCVDCHAEFDRARRLRRFEEVAMPLNVDTQELVAVAAKLAATARDARAAMPVGWVVPAGADSGSAQAVPEYNAQAALVVNGMMFTWNKIHRLAYNVGAAAVDYTEADDRGAREIGGSGGDIVANPVGEVQEVSLRRPPTIVLPSGGEVEPLIFAQQLHTGPGPGPAMGFANELRSFVGGPHLVATEGVGSTVQALQRWEPVGSEAATELGQYRGWLDQLGSALGLLADGIDTYGGAFRTAKAKHPTPEEIIAVRKELLSAMRSKNQTRIQAALAKFTEQNARSTETITGYSTDLGSTVGASESTGSGSGSGDSSALTQMLPALMSAMASAGMPLSQLGQSDTSDAYDDYGLDDYGYDNLGIPSGLGTGSPSGMPAGSPGLGIPDVEAATIQASALPVAAAASLGSGMPRTPVIEPLGTSSAANATAARGGSPMMPYMPMAPGMGNSGGNNDRNRVVAWHPDRLMYVDDTPHTEAVIGERPTIAPSVTPPTPAPGNQTPSQAGPSA